MTNPTIVGVLPQAFDFLSRDLRLLVPMPLRSEEFENRRTHRLQVLGRLRPDVSVERAQAEMSALADTIRAAHPEWMTGWGVNVAPLFDEEVGSVRPTLLVLLGAVGFVVLIATFNVASLLLGRATERQRELAVRVALGAGRGHLVRQLLAESMLLGVVGGGAGLLWAAAGTGAILALAPAELPRIDDVGIDARVLLAGIGLSLLAGLGCGVVPALQASRTDVQPVLKDGGRTGTGGRRSRRLRWGLVVSELAFSVVLLTGAGLMIRTIVRLMNVDPGYRPERVLTTTIALPQSRYEDAAAGARFFERFLEDVRALPGVLSAGATRFLPLDEEWTFSFVIDGQAPPREGEKRDYGLHPVSVDYFQTVGMAMVSGRSFTERDYAGPPVAMINEAMAARFWPGADPRGQRIKFARDPGADDPWFEIVGMVGDVRQQGPDLAARPAVYIPYAHPDTPFWSRQMSLAIRTATPPAGLIGPLRDALRARDPGLILTGTRTMTDALAESMARRRFAMVLLGLFGLAALTLASIGVYGVVAYTVGQRRQEMGIRMALGASPREIVALVVSQGMVPVAAGVALGLAGALLTSRFLATLLYGVTPADPMTLAAATLVLAGVGLVACLVPARRASRVDVLGALRTE